QHQRGVLRHVRLAPERTEQHQHADGGNGDGKNDEQDDEPDTAASSHPFSVARSPSTPRLRRWRVEDGGWRGGWRVVSERLVAVLIAHGRTGSLTPFSVLDP